MIDVSPWFIVTLFVYFVTGNTAIAFIAYLSAFVHELSHVAVAKILGCPVKKISFLACGFNAQLENLGSIPCFKEIIIALSGPFVNLFLSLLVIFLPIDYNLRVLAAKINIYMFAINLLPVYPLDGGRVVYAFLKNEIPQKKACKIMSIISVGVSLLVLTVGVICVVLWQKNLSLLIVSIYIFSNLTFEKQQVEDSRSIKKMKVFCCSQKSDFGEIIFKTGINRSILIFVTDENENVCGYITGGDLKKAAFENRYGENVMPYVKEITNGGIFNGN